MQYISVPHLPQRLWRLMEEGVERSLTVAFLLLPILLAIRCYHDYTACALGEEPASRALLRALWAAMWILIILIAYKELMMLLDKLTFVLIEHLGDRPGWIQHLKATKERLHQQQAGWLFKNGGWLAPACMSMRYSLPSPMSATALQGSSLRRGT